MFPRQHAGRPRSVDGDTGRRTTTGDDMSMYGANPDQLASLGTTLTRQIDTISQLMGLVDSALNGTTWQGPARERFAAEWT